jgi:L-threonylcarbamoyladenylate synthase
MPRILAIDAHTPDGRAVAEAAAVLRGGGLVAFPTETVYGLGALALDPNAIARVYAAKGRPENHPLIAHVLGEDEAKSLAADWPELASRLARALWPGPITLVVERAAGVSSAVSGGGPSIAVRAPAHAVARALIAAVGAPIAAPSANRYQSLSPTTAAHVVKQLGDAVDLVLDGGACQAGIESTVIDVRDARPRVLRPGAASMARLRALLPHIEAQVHRAAEGAPRASPGMDARHYSPRARLEVVARGEISAAVAARAATGRLVGVVVRDAPNLPDLHVAPRPNIVRSLPDDPEAYAARLYATLHELDECGVDDVVVEAVPDAEDWLAVADRLRRAAASG